MKITVNNPSKKLLQSLGSSLFNQDELTNSPEYWIEKIQNQLYRELIQYQEKEKLTKTQLAKRLEISVRRLNKMLSGECMYRLDEIIKISLLLSKEPLPFLSP